VLVLALVACLVVAMITAFRVMKATDDPQDAPHVLGFSVHLRVLDESGSALVGATVDLHGLDVEGGPPTRLTSGADGTVQTPVLRGPALAVVAEKDHLSEPVPLGWSDSEHPVEVKLFARKADRFAMHSAGDVMFGRRYVEPEAGTPPLIPPGAAEQGAEHVVSAIAPAFAAADLSTVNLETVLSDRPKDTAYPKKRFILESGTATVAGLRKLGVDVAVLANNHSRDFLEDGIADTRDALAKAGVGMVGADVTADGAAIPFHTTVGGTSVGIAAFTSVDGDFVNGSYPTGAAPPDVAATEAWQYDLRTWGFGGIPAAPRRIGQAWEEYQRAAPNTDTAALWTSLVAVYPELQDWVARRGHGGAAAWDPVTSPGRITALAAANRLVVVQLHAGFQFQDAESDNVRDIAHAAIDAGADIVIGHHPHVVQGMEWYKGHLIMYSLGNFVFDQNFLSTFSSAVLRTVWEGDRLLEARLLPLELVDYRPVPLTDDAARQVLGRLWERSLLPASTTRDAGGAVRAYPRAPDPDSRPGQVVVEHNTGRITAEVGPEASKQVTVPAHEVVDLGNPPGALSRPTSGDGVEVGRDLFGWGRFEDESADGGVGSAIHWKTDSAAESWMTGPTPQGRRFLHLRAPGGKAVQTRAVARIALPRHRLHTPVKGGSAPVDPEPAYSLRAMVRASATGSSYVRFGVYHFDDSNPTEDPTSAVLSTITRQVDVPNDGGWHQVTVDLSPADLDTADGVGNMVMLYAGLPQRSDGRESSMDLDDVRFVEWRDAAGMTGAFGDFDLVRNGSDQPREIALVTRTPNN
jgi:poly-gamma-glutamate capsule biosynthesis protein CapA/YwtB (metallophosphatase superfamily)